LVEAQIARRTVEAALGTPVRPVHAPMNAVGTAPASGRSNRRPRRLAQDAGFKIIMRVEKTRAITPALFPGESC